MRKEKFYNVDCKELLSTAEKLCRVMHRNLKNSLTMEEIEDIVHDEIYRLAEKFQPENGTFYNFCRKYVAGKCKNECEKKQKFTSIDEIEVAEVAETDDDYDRAAEIFDEILADDERLLLQLKLLDTKRTEIAATLDLREDSVSRKFSRIAQKLNSHKEKDLLIEHLVEYLKNNLIYNKEVA